jgi:hypothetical protein
MKSINSELSLAEVTVASLAWSRARPTDPEAGRRVSIFAGDAACVAPLVVWDGVGPPAAARLEGGGPLGPVERMNSANSCVDSLGTRASRANEPDRAFVDIETGGLDPGPV